MKMRDEERAEEVRLEGPAGSLEGLFELPEGGAAPRAAAIVCHPHPLHEGTMRNTIVYRTARALRRVGLATLRFNFRGVGASEGAHDGHGAEEGDAAAALGFLAERCPGSELWAAGYSFGSRTVGRLATRDERIARLVLIAVPILAYDCSFLREVRQPGFLLFGRADSFGTLSALVRLHPGLPEGLEVDEIPGADHFFRGRTPLVEEKVHEYARRVVRGEP